MKIEPLNQPAVFISPTELSRRWMVSKMTLHRWRRDNKIKSLHIGRQVRFALSEVERFEAQARA
jgi:excisionase family DNA binding protein